MPIRQVSLKCWIICLMLLLAVTPNLAMAQLDTTATSSAPSQSPAPSKSPAPSHSVIPTSNNTISIPPSNPPSNSPSPAPSQVPTGASTPPPHHPISAWAVLGKTIAWLLISALAILLFGAVFSNRYRIYYWLQSAWYAFLGWNVTRKVLRFLRLDGYFGGYRESTLNGVIFYNDLSRELMMQET